MAKGPDWNDEHRTNPGAIRDAMIEPDIPFNDPQEGQKYRGNGHDCSPFEPGEPSRAFTKIIDPADWEDVPVPEREWTVPDYIPHNAVTLLSGDGGQGKSLLALQLAVARALAKDWIGLLPEPGRTLVLSAEDDSDEMHRRLDDIRKFYGASWTDLADIRLIDLVGDDPLLAVLAKGKIEPSPAYEALNDLVAKFKPSLVILDVSADLFPGDESDRAHVRQFINLLKGICRKHDCAILLLAHPSLTGMNTGTGLSGSTDWNNGVRSRLYLKTPKDSDGAPTNKLRTFEGMKSNYGECGGKIDVEWKAGVFVRVNGPTGFSKLAAEQKADDIFLSLLARFEREGRDVSPNPSVTFAPTVFAKHEDAKGLNKDQLRAAMDRLLKDGKVKINTTGKPSKQKTTLVLADD
jgi:RecA-family ATPase